jgi:ATP-binding cassette subfamily B protein
VKKLRFRDLLYRYRYAYLAGLVCLIVTDTAQLLIPRVIKEAIDTLVEGEHDASQLFVRYFIILLVLSGVIFVFRFFWRYFNIGSSWRIARDLRERLFLHLESLSPSFYRDHDAGTLMALMTNDIDAVRMSCGFAIVIMIDALFLATFSLTMMLLINVRLTLLALIPMPFIALLVMRFGRLLHNRFREVQASFASISARAREVFSGIRVVKSFTLEEDEAERFSHLSSDYMRKNIRLAWIWGNLFPTVTLFSQASSLVILWVGGLLVMREHISLGDFVAFNAYIGILTWPMMGIGFVTNMYQRGRASFERINTILDNEPEVKDSPGAVPLGNCRGHIEFRKCTFRYNDNQPPVLADLNLAVRPGETLGVTGRIGSGKSTLVRLLCRLYDPPPGSVFIDGTDILDIRLKDLRESIAVVPQDPFLFSDTLGANIEFGDPAATREKVRELLSLVKLDGKGRERRLGYDTVVGEGGITLSGGQKQRATIARGIVKRARIVVLDDVLSSVDTRTEEEILKALPSLTANRTTVIISHRISALQVADRIVVLGEGRVAEEGTHVALKSAGGYYEDLCRKQKLLRYGLI